MSTAWLQKLCQYLYRESSKYSYCVLYLTFSSKVLNSQLLCSDFCLRLRLLRINTTVKAIIVNVIKVKDICGSWEWVCSDLRSQYEEPEYFGNQKRPWELCEKTLQRSRGVFALMGGEITHRKWCCCSWEMERYQFSPGPG